MRRHRGGRLGAGHGGVHWWPAIASNWRTSVGVGREREDSAAAREVQDTLSRLAMGCGRVPDIYLPLRRKR